MNNTQGFYIKKLVSTGTEKTDAIVTFEKGLNVITGASNTGKSYIVECLYYMLSGSNKSIPEDIDESVGYTDLYLELATYSGEKITLHRKIGKTTYKVWNCSFDSISKNIPSDYKLIVQDTDKSKTIDHLLLSTTGCEYYKLKKNKSGKLERLTLSGLKLLTIIDEHKIISKNSVILSKGYVNHTSDKSAFKAIVTGIDDSNCEAVETKESYKTKVLGKLELVEQLMSESEKIAHEKQKALSEINHINIESKILEIENNIQHVSNIINERTESRGILWEELAEIKSHIIRQNELLNRFTLLKNSYSSDIKRLDFTLESGHYLTQLVNVECPICHNMTKNQNDIDFVSMKESFNHEKRKILVKVKDLNETIDSLNIDISQKEKQSLNITIHLKTIEHELEEHLLPTIKISKEDLNEYRAYLQQKSEYQTALSTYEKNKALKQNLLLEKDSKPEECTYISEIPQEDYKSLCSEIETLLKAWKFQQHKDVLFDKTTNDLLINGKQRTSNGKGVRAVLHSAFTIGLMKFLRSPERAESKHPGFVVLDSPLTSYKQGENAVNNDQISKDTENAFFENLANIGDDMQVIIIDNKEPNQEICKKINYVKFTGTDEGRYGFFPVNKN